MFVIRLYHSVNQTLCYYIEEEEHEFIWLHNKKYTIVVIVQR